MILNTHPDDRKTMVRAISDLMNVPAVYQYIPTYAYKIGEITVNRDGTIEAEEDVLEQIKPMLIERGWLEEREEHMPENEEMAENQEATEPEETAPEGEENPDAVTSPETPVEAATSENRPVSGNCGENRPVSGDCGGNVEGVTRLKIAASEMTATGIQNLVRMMYTNQNLINRMVRMDSLRIDPEVIDLLEGKKDISELEAMLQDETRVGMLKGFTFEDGNVTVTMPTDCPVSWEDYSLLMEHIIRRAQISKYTRARVLEAGANEKYHANTWLAWLGFRGKEHKRIRNVFMGHLRGYAAFRDDERMLDHKYRLAEQRRIKRELAQE